MERERRRARPGRVRWSDEVEIEDLYVRVPVLDDDHIWKPEPDLRGNEQGTIENHLPALLREVGLPPVSASPDRDLDDVDNLAFANPITSHSRPERLSCSREGFLLLGVVRRAPELSRCWDAHSSDFARIKKSTIDSPLLVADAECKTAHSSWPYDPDLENLGFPLVEVDEELNEGLPWPLSSREVSKDDVTVLWREKVEVKTKDLLFLQQAIQIDASSCASVVQADRDVNTKVSVYGTCGITWLTLGCAGTTDGATLISSSPCLSSSSSRGSCHGYWPTVSASYSHESYFWWSP